MASMTNELNLALRLDQVSVRFQGVQALDGVSVDIPRNSITALVGPNGAGKSTLLNAVSGFVPVTEGEVTVDGQRITGLEIRKRVNHGIVRSFQTPRLIEGVSVEDNVLLGRERFAKATIVEQLLRSRRYRREDSRDRELTREICEVLGIAEYLARSVSDLPYGVRRLVTVARVLAAEPELLLLDEPAAGLDGPSRQLLAEAIGTFHSQRPVTVIVVEHDIQLVRLICPKAVILDRGKVIAAGATKEVLDSEVVREAYFG